MSRFFKVTLCGIMSASVALLLASCSPNNREECITDASKAPTAEGVDVATTACYDKYPAVPEKPTSPESKNTVSSTREICHVYWDGIEWKLGKANKDNFMQLKWTKYDVDLVYFNIPNVMAERFGMINKDGDFYKDNVEFKEFFDSHFYQIKIICNI